MHHALPTIPHSVRPLSGLLAQRLRRQLDALLGPDRRQILERLADVTLTLAGDRAADERDEGEAGCNDGAEDDLACQSGSATQRRTTMMTAVRVACDSVSAASAAGFSAAP